MKKIISALLAMGICSHATAQKSSTVCPKIFFTSSQLTDTVCDKSIKKICITASGNVLIKYYNNKEKKLIDEVGIWGIRQKGENVRRYYQGHFYSVNQLSPLMRYSRRIGKSTEYYFSTEPDAPIYSFTPKLVKRYADSLSYAAIAEEVRTIRRELSFDFFALNSNILNHKMWGGGIEIKAYLQRKWATGFTLSGSGKSTSDSFGFPIRKPVFHYYEAGWINQFDLIQQKNFRLGINLTNGLAITDLRDKAEKEKVRTRYGYRDAPKKISASYYYLLQPGLDLSYKIISNRHYPDFFFTGKMRYSAGFGKTNFGDHQNFSATWFAVGLSLIGFDRDEF
jgi:hypothetical protein